MPLMARRRPLGRRMLSFAAVFIAAFAVYFVAMDRMNQPAVGDEAHYILEAHSLVEDGDRDLADDYADRALWSQFVPFRTFTPELQAFDYNGRGVISIHNVGLPVLIAPAVAMFDSLRAVRVDLLFIAALAAAMLLGLLRDLRIAGPVWTVAVWAIVAFSAPLTMFAGEAFPEMTAAALVLIGVRAALRGPAARGWFAAGALAAAALPWLHVRFALLAVGIVAALAARAWPARREAGWLPLAMTIAPLVVSLLAMGVAFNDWYGSPRLDAQYRDPAPAGVGSHTDGPFLYTIGLGQFLSPESGLLPVAPVMILALAGLPLLWRRFGRWSVYATTVGAAYAAVCLTVNPATAFPGRYLVVLLPLAAVPLLVAVADAPVVRPVVALLGVVGFALTVDGVTHPTAWYRVGDGLINSPLGRKLHDAWPNMSIPFAVDHYPDAALAFAWLGWIGFATLLVWAGRRRRAG
jgi:hypothetical protein